MNKILITILLGLTVALPVHATLYGFMDGKYYDESYTLKYICFMDNNCIDKDDNIVHRDTWQQIEPISIPQVGVIIPKVDPNITTGTFTNESVPTLEILRTTLLFASRQDRDSFVGCKIHEGTWTWPMVKNSISYGSQIDKNEIWFYLTLVKSDCYKLIVNTQVKTKLTTACEDYGLILMPNQDSKNKTLKCY